MSTWVLLLIVVWLLVAIAAGVAIGTAISTADRAGEGRAEKACCPHDPAGAPETVRGEFRAVVIPLPPQRPDRIDVRA